MFTCDKCGARLADGLKYCDKCGSQVGENVAKQSDVVGLNDIKPLDEKNVKDKKDFKTYFNILYSYLPNSLIDKDNKTASG